MTLIDWIILFSFLLILIVIAVMSRVYSRSVADFLVANRCADRYLLTVADGMAGVGAITILAYFEMYFANGFSGVWWSLIFLNVTAVLMLTGWIVYRYRQSRVLTLAQLLEVRYSRKFRVFAGILMWVSGVMNFGIFPAVSARFFIHFCNLPSAWHVSGFEISTYVFLLIILIVIALLFTYLGGFVSIIITEFMQGAFSNFVFIIAVGYLLYRFGWSSISSALQDTEQGVARLNPFDISTTGEKNQFGFGYFIMQAFLMFYNYMTWQGNQGYNGAARNPHEARMGKILGTWRTVPMTLFIIFLPVCAFVFLQNGTSQSLAAHNQLASIPSDVLRSQMTTVVAITHIFPPVLIGLISAMMLAAFIGTSDTYLHSWGSIFVQDIIMPFKKKPFSPKTHIFVLKLSIFGVACFIFLFSWLFRQTEHIIMFMNMTGVIFTGGGGAVLIGGLYWKKGTAKGAWAAMICSATLAFACIILRQVHQEYTFDNRLVEWFACQNGMTLAFIESVVAFLIYIIVSLLDCKEDYDFDKLLHRGGYAVASDMSEEKKKVGSIGRFLGINEDFSKSDKIIYIASILWVVVQITIFALITALNSFYDFSIPFWAGFWKWYVIIFLTISVTITLWFVFGGFRNLGVMLRTLKTVLRDNADDGMVTENNIAETVSNEKILKS